MLAIKAEESLNGKTYKNLVMGGSNIQKDEIIRIFLGLYHIVYEYNGKQHSVYITGDGKNYIYDDAPIDSQRQQLLEEKKSAKNSMPKRQDCF